MRGPNPHGGEAGTKRFVDPFAPCDVPPGVSRQRLGELLAPTGLRSAVSWRRVSVGDQALPGPSLGRSGPTPGGQAGPTTERRRHSQAHAHQRRSERRVDPVTGVRQHHPFRHALGAGGAGSGRARFAVWSCRRRPRARRLWPGELDRPPNPQEDRAERRSAGSRARWLPTTTPQSDNCPACRVARESAGRRQRNERPSSEIPRRRR